MSYENNEIQNLSKEIDKLKEDLDIWGLFDDKMIPYNYEKYLYKSIRNLQTKRFENWLKSFKTRQLRYDIPNPLINKNGKLKDGKILLATTYLKNSNEFYNVGNVSKIDTQPIFYYYSIVYLFSFLSESFIEFKNRKEHHGLKLKLNNNETEISTQIKIEYGQYGFFQRLVNTLSILQYPSNFSSFITDFDESDNSILTEQNNDLSIQSEMKKILSLKTLIEYNFSMDMYNAKRYTSIVDYEIRYETSSNIIRD